jgi:hypothetical protein
MTTLIIEHGSSIVRNLIADLPLPIATANHPWILFTEFIEAIPGVTNASAYGPDWTITFESEEHKNWFLLHYS